MCEQVHTREVQACCWCSLCTQGKMNDKLKPPVSTCKENSRWLRYSHAGQMVSSGPISRLPTILDPPRSSFISQFGSWTVADASNAAWSFQEMTASRCMSRLVCVFRLCTTADAEINAGWRAREIGLLFTIPCLRFIWISPSVLTCL